MKRVLVIAGEASGDNYGSLLIRELKKMSPQQEVWAIGGDQMRSAGARLISHYSEISVVGLVEVLGKLSRIMGLLKEVKGLIKEGKIHCVVLIDFPDFNFIIGKYTKKFDIPVIYYIPPQMWAWREGRAKVLKNISDHIVVPFPFEVDFYRKHRVDVEYCGHPLLEILREEDVELDSIESFSTRSGETLRVGLFPGSRESEISRLLPLQLGGGNVLKDKFKDVEFYLPMANSFLRGIIEKTVEKFQLDVDIIAKRDYSIFREIDVAVASSGTVTLELAIFGVPTVIIYKVSPLTYIIGKMLVKVDRIGLPNIITGEKMFPELVQNDATPHNIAGEVERFFVDSAMVEKVKEKSHELVRTLDGDGPSKRIAELVLQEVRC